MTDQPNTENTTQPNIQNPMNNPKVDSIVTRAKNIILKPEAEWAKIETEQATVSGLFKDYALILAAIPAICGLIGGLVFGYGFAGFSYHPSLMGALGSAIAGYVVSVVGVGVLAFVINALAETFGGQKNQIQAFKVSVYSATAAWLAGAFGIVPGLAMLGILGLYSLYLLYLGIPKLMKCPQDKAITYTVCVVIAAIIINAIAMAVVNPMRYRAPANYSVSVSGDEGQKVNLGALQQLGENAAKAAKQVEEAQKKTLKPVSGDQVKALLPDSVGDGFARTSIQVAQGNVMGMQGTTASAVYQNGQADITVSIVDIGSSGLAAMASVFSVESSKETQNGYSKTGKVDGRWTVEDYSKSSESSQYMTLVGERFMVQVEGKKVPMDKVKSLVSSFISPLESLAN